MTARISLPASLACLACLFLVTTSCGVERTIAPDAEMAASAALLSGTPTSLSASPISDVAIRLHWQDNTDHESGYEIHRAAGSTGDFAAVASVGTNATSYADGDRAELTEYCYMVRAFRTRGSKTTYSAFSNTACATTLGPPPAPSNARALPGPYGGIEVLWADNSTLESGFRVRRTTSAGTAAFEVWANSTSYTDWAIPIEEEACYHVTAFNSYGESGPSNTDCIGLPAAPTNLRATSVSSTTIDLAWDDVSGFEDGFELQAMYCYWSYPYYYYYYYPGEPTYVCYFSHVQATLGPNSTSYQVTGLSPSTTYSYQVVAFKKKEDRTWYSGANGVLDATTEP